MMEDKELPDAAVKWEEVFAWFEVHPGTPLEIETENLQRAKSVRYEFYRARKALLDGAVGHYPSTRRREAILEQSKVIFREKEHGTIAELLEKGLQAADGKDNGNG